MRSSGEKFLVERLKSPEMTFAQRLRLVYLMVPQVSPTASAQMIHHLLESAVAATPTQAELRQLCQMCAENELLSEYVRGFFVMGDYDPRRVMIAEQLGQIVSWRLGRMQQLPADERLQQTIAEYLLRARN